MIFEANMKNMIILDLDGTAITNSYQLSNELIHIIKRISLEHLVFIATGRSVSDSYKYYKMFDLNNELICNNGAIICHPYTGEIRYQRNIDNASNILTLLIRGIDKYGVNNIVLSKCTDTYLFNQNNSYLHSIMIDERLPYYYVGKEIINIQDIQRIIISTLPSCKKKLEDALITQFEDIAICGWRGREDIIDISVKSVSKWNAVMDIAKNYNIDVSEIIAFGDGINDIELLSRAGVGICMANGNSEAKKVADYVTVFDNNEKGVYKFILDKLGFLFHNILN